MAQRAVDVVVGRTGKVGVAVNVSRDDDTSCDVDNIVHLAISDPFSHGCDFAVPKAQVTHFVHLIGGIDYPATS
jgi:hypothetical protein